MIADILKNVVLLLQRNIQKSIKLLVSSIGWVIWRGFRRSCGGAGGGAIKRYYDVTSQGIFGEVGKFLVTSEGIFSVKYGRGRM